MRIKHLLILISVLMTMTSQAFATVTIGGTRVIFDGTKKEASLGIVNNDKVTNLVQSWIVPADSATPGKEAMIITPPLFRLEVGAKNVLRIALSGLPMPQDKESMYWLNVKGIAASSEDLSSNSLQIAVNSRIKLIYRPASLVGTYPEKSTQQIQWSIANHQLVVNNPTRFYMNFAIVKINGRPIDSVTWVSPKSNATFPLPADVSNGKITWKIYNDFGMAGDEHESQL
ncbi:fimbria/pilus periplasmic chaperone [Enterobacter roggenkampii]|uniref:fimbria/pilus periplasmic chaperone n=1 Tax=Enterobacter roggenkampii TaxID=1812935 RepID=UPI0032AF1A49